MTVMEDYFVPKDRRRLTVMEDYFVPKDRLTPFVEIKKTPNTDIEDSFVGPLPEIGDRVEFVCVARTALSVKLQLRVIPEKDQTDDA
jgi:hypothetical protein